MVIDRQPCWAMVGALLAAPQLVEVSASRRAAAPVLTVRSTLSRAFGAVREPPVATLSRPFKRHRHSWLRAKEAALPDRSRIFMRACTKILLLKTGDQIGLEGLPLMLSASLLPGIHKTLT